MPNLAKTLSPADLAAVKAAVAQLGQRRSAELLGISRQGVRGLLAGKPRSRALLAGITQALPRLLDAARARGAVNV